MPDVAKLKPTLKNIRDLMKTSGAGLVHAPKDSLWMFCVSHFGPFSGSRRDGVMLTGGWVYYCPQFVVEGETIKVMLHRIMTALPPKEVFTALTEALRLEPSVYTYQDWEQIEEKIALFDPFDRKRKLVTLQSWVRDAVFIDNTPMPDAKIDRFCQEIKDAFVTTVSANINIKWLTGRDIVKKYEGFERGSPSCMTGECSDKTELWATNHNQCALCVVLDHDDEIARTLCFRPLPSMDRCHAEIPAGEGWYHSRIYDVGSSFGCSGTRGDRTAEAAAYLHRSGVQHITSAPASTCVPLIVTDQAPYIDVGGVLAAEYDEGADCYWIPCVGSRPDFIPPSFYTIENNQHGTAFGRRDSNSSNVCCPDCEGECSELFDVGGHMVCMNCLERGDYVSLHDGGYCHSDNSLEIVSRENPTSDAYACEDSESIRYFGRLHINVGSYAGSRVFAPESECIDVNGDQVWIQNPEEQTYENIHLNFEFVGGYVKVSTPRPPTMERSEDCVTVFGVDGPVRCVLQGRRTPPVMYFDECYTKANVIFYDNCALLQWNDREYKYRAIEHGWVAYGDDGIVVLSSVPTSAPVGAKMPDLPIVNVITHKVLMTFRASLLTFGTYPTVQGSPAIDAAFCDSSVTRVLDSTGHAPYGYDWIDEMFTAKTHGPGRHLVIRTNMVPAGGYAESISEVIMLGNYLILLANGIPVHIAIWGSSLQHIIDRPMTSLVLFDFGTYRTSSSLALSAFDISTHTGFLVEMNKILSDTNINTMQDLRDTLAQTITRGQS